MKSILGFLFGFVAMLLVSNFILTFASVVQAIEPVVDSDSLMEGGKMGGTIITACPPGPYYTWRSLPFQTLAFLGFAFGIGLIPFTVAPRWALPIAVLPTCVGIVLAALDWRSSFPEGIEAPYSLPLTYTFSLLALTATALGAFAAARVRARSKR